MVPSTPGAPATGSPVNPWLVAGVQTGYSLNGGEFADNFQAAGRTLVEVLGKSSDKGGVFVMANLSRLKNQADADEATKLKEIQQSNQGINIGVFPHKIFNKDGSADMVFWSVYAPITYKLNSFKQTGTAESVYLNQFRLGAGFEICFLPGQSAKLPTTFSLEPNIGFFNENDYNKIFGKEKSSLLSLEATLIIPAGVGKGFMFSYSNSTENSSQFTAGLIFTGAVSEK
ncbi:hypothetical protein SAMN06269173_11531 [Hymenobacter mucosus]|uniref:MetA-pathway of phenol degradation n=2 Tax=Hymenobacter mucosus TaxID=1411120 RepID=A0A239AT84_9BACT|nr:hypothetical protein SAMN06269173_11531 [Hymenobacter mucosus]